MSLEIRSAAFLRRRTNRAGKKTPNDCDRCATRRPAALKAFPAAAPLACAPGFPALPAKARRLRNLLKLLTQLELRTVLAETPSLRELLGAAEGTLAFSAAGRRYHLLCLTTPCAAA